MHGITHLKFGHYSFLKNCDMAQNFHIWISNQHWRISQKKVSFLLYYHKHLALRYCILRKYRIQRTAASVLITPVPDVMPNVLYRGADKSLARPGRKQATSMSNLHE
jgi:hypothetical protein